MIAIEDCVSRARTALHLARERVDGQACKPAIRSVLVQLQAIDVELLREIETLSTD